MLCIPIDGGLYSNSKASQHDPKLWTATKMTRPMLKTSKIAIFWHCNDFRNINAAFEIVTRCNMSPDQPSAMTATLRAAGSTWCIAGAPRLAAAPAATPMPRCMPGLLCEGPMPFVPTAMHSLAKLENNC